MQSHSSSQVGAEAEQTQTENRKYVMIGAAAGGEGEEPHTQERQLQKLRRACRGSMALLIPWFQLLGTASRLLAPRTVNDKSVPF